MLISKDGIEVTSTSWDADEEIAKLLAEIFKEYWLEGVEINEVVTISVNYVSYQVRQKVLN